MPVLATITVTGTKTGLETGSTAIAPAVITNATSVANTTTQSFAAATFAAVTVPTGAVGVIIKPPAANLGTITMKGVTGDTGIPLHKTNAHMQSLEVGATFGILCSALTVIEFCWF